MQKVVPKSGLKSLSLNLLAKALDKSQKFQLKDSFLHLKLKFAAEIEQINCRNTLKSQSHKLGAKRLRAIKPNQKSNSMLMYSFVNWKRKVLLILRSMNNDVSKKKIIKRIFSRLENTLKLILNR